MSTEQERDDVRAAEAGLDRNRARVLEMLAESYSVRWYKPWTWHIFFGVFGQMREIDRIVEQNRRYSDILARPRAPKVKR